MALRDLFEIAENPNNYTAVRIKIATSDEVTSWSHGEVRTSETINSVSYTHLTLPTNREV